MKRYDIYWANLDPTQGSEINKTRPCIVVSPDELNMFLDTVVVVPLTSTIRDSYRFRLNVVVNGKAGQVAVDQIRTIDKRRLVGRIASLSPTDAEELRCLLNEMFCA